MKRNLAISATLVSFLFILTGCGSKTAAVSGSQNSQPQAAQANQTGQKRGMPDYGQPSRPADIRGIVRSIIGNQASILLVASPVGGGKGASSTNATPGTPTANTAPSISLSGVTGGAGGGRQGGGPGGPGGGTTDRTAMIDQIKKLSTGQADVVIPVGIQMLKPSTTSANNKREMVEASLSDITADKFITIWLNTSVTDKKVAEFVLIN